MRRLIALVLMFFIGSTFAADKYWTGANSASASVAGNWCDDPELKQVSTAAPTEGDNIYLTQGSAAMTWDINNISIGSWTQDGYTGTVTFYTGNKQGISANVYGYLSDDGVTRILKATGDIVLNTGTWTTPNQPSMSSSYTAWKNGQGVYRMIVDVDGKFTLGSGATINLINKGFYHLQGPGTGTYNKSCGTHGGMGASCNSSALNKNCYGVVHSPITIGSGSGNSGNRGGGAVQLKVGGVATINGTITVAGQDASYHIGAGGSIYIIAESLVGETGLLNANGGAGSAHSHDGGGGGGRIAIKLTGTDAKIDSFKGTYQAQGGDYSGKSALNDATGGTIYIEEGSVEPKKGTLIIDGLNRGNNVKVLGKESYTLLNESILDGVVPKKIVLRSYAKLGLGFNGEYTLPPYEIGATSSVVVCPNCNLVLDRPLDFTLYLGEADAVVTPGEELNGELVLNSGIKLYAENKATINGSLRIKSGGVITHYKDQTSRFMNFTVTGDMTVEEGGSITANSLGNGSRGRASEYGGGSYGGRSGNSFMKCYGSVREPASYGSTGKSNVVTVNGGGLIRFTVNGKLVVNGTITCNGSSSSQYPGSGGSIYIKAKSISGAGSITANGGEYTGKSTVSSGGGRIAIHLTGEGEDFSSFDISKITAYGGVKSSTNIGGAGTVYLKNGDEAINEGTLIIKNKGIPTSYTDFITGSVTDLDVGKVLIENARLFVSNTTVKVSRGWETSSTAVLTSEENGNIQLIGDDDFVIKGINEFYSIKCEVPGKKLKFGTTEGDVFSVCEGGIVGITGTEEKPIELLPAVEGETWRIKLPTSKLSEFNMQYLLVDRSDASQGEAIISADSAEKTQGSNVNWRFATIVYGEENKWLGTTSAEWSDPSNWSLGRIPVETDNITISPSDNTPELSADIVALGFVVEAGAKVKLSGYNLTVQENFSINGIIECSSKERITLAGSTISIASGSLVSAYSTLVITGSGEQSVSMNANLYDLVVEKTGGSISWSGASHTARKILFASTDTEISFASGTYLKTDVFEANGINGEQAALKLSGSWQLDAKTYASATGVQLGGCDASRGVSLVVNSPYVNLEENNNCIFNESPVVWTGAAGDSRFQTAGNWKDGIAPAEGDYVEIPAGASISISSATKVGSLFVVGGEAATTLTVSGSLEVSGSLYVGPKATLILDAPVVVNGQLLIDAGGVITHTRGGSAETYKMNLTVYGNMSIEKSARVHADGKGYTAATGPAYGSLGIGASHGGCGSYNTDASDVKRCYGSYIAPNTYGSGGYSQGAGGGVVKITVGGELRNDGVISADGAQGADWYTSSGGSIHIKCGNLTGAGLISAVGGMGVSNNQGGGLLGGGGRIAIEKTTDGDFSGFLGSVTASGAPYTVAQDPTRMPHGSAGPVTWTLPNSRPLIIVDNKGSTAQHCLGIELPTSSAGDTPKEMRKFDIVLRNSGILSLQGDVRIYDLALETSNTKLYLNGYKLTIASLKHKNRKDWLGTVYTGTGGSIEWISGFAVTVR